ncbi:hypothetical protein THAOC_00811, partial [Thalassiosira oceanica]
CRCRPEAFPCIDTVSPLTRTQSSVPLWPEAFPPGYTPKSPPLPHWDTILAELIARRAHGGGGFTLGGGDAINTNGASALVGCGSLIATTGPLPQKLIISSPKSKGPAPTASKEGVALSSTSWQPPAHSGSLAAHHLVGGIPGVIQSSDDMKNDEGVIDNAYQQFKIQNLDLLRSSDLTLLMPHLSLGKAERDQNVKSRNEGWCNQKPIKITDDAEEISSVDCFYERHMIVFIVSYPSLRRNEGVELRLAHNWVSSTASGSLREWSSMEERDVFWLVSVVLLVVECKKTDRISS